MLELNDLVESREDDLMLPDDAASAHCRDSDLVRISLFALAASVIFVLIDMSQRIIHGIRQRQCRAARCILLLRVVHLLYADVVTADAADHFGQLPVEPEQQVDPQRVVRGVEKGPAPLLAAGFQFVEAIRPARRAAYDRRTGVDAGADVVVGRCGRRELPVCMAEDAEADEFLGIL